MHASAIFTYIRNSCKIIHMAQKHFIPYIRKQEALNWGDSTVAQKLSVERSVGSGKCFAPFPFQKVPSENHPIKISFHFSNHFMRLTEGNARAAVRREWVLLGWFHCRLNYNNSHLNWPSSFSPPWKNDFLRKLCNCCVRLHKITGEFSFIFVYKV